MISIIITLLFSFLLLFSFSLNRPVGNKNYHLFIFTLIAGCFFFFQNNPLQVLLFCLLPLPFILMERGNKNLFFFKFSAIASLILALSSLLFDQSSLYSCTFLILAMMMRQGIFPFHFWLLDVKNNQKNFPYFVFFLILQSGAFLYSRAELQQAIPANILHYLGSFALLSGIYLAVRAKSSNINLEKHILILASQSSLLITGISHPSEITNIAATIYSLMIAVSGILFSMIAYELYSQKGIEKLNQYFSIYRTNKRLAFIYLVSGMNLVGLPLTIGYFADDVLFHSLAENSQLDSLFFITIMVVNGHTIYQMFCRLFFGHVSHHWVALYFSRSNKFLIAATAFIIVTGTFFILPIGHQIEFYFAK